MKTIAAFFVTVLNFSVLIALGLLLKTQIHAQIPIAVEFVFLGVAALLIVVNAILMLNQKKQSEIDMMKIREELLKHKEELSKDFSSFNKKMLRLSFFTKAAFLAVYVLLSALIVLRAYLATSETVVLFILYGYVLYVFCSSFLRLLGFDKIVYAKKKDYPKLYALIEKTAQEMGVKKKIRLSFSEEGSASIREKMLFIHLNLGLAPLFAASEKELKSVLIHEFAHYLNKDLKNSNKIFSTVAWLNETAGDPFFIMKFLLLFAAETFLKQFTKYEVNASFEKELAADRMVKQYGLEQQFIDQTVKDYLYILFYSELPSYNLFESKTASEDRFRRLYALFREELKSKQTFWEGIALKEIPARFQTHPTLPERLKNLGVDSFTADFSEKDFAEEAIKAAEVSDAETHRYFVKNYPRLRYQNYVLHKNRTEEYEKEFSQREFEEIELLDTADFYRTLTQHDKAFELYEKILQKNPESVGGLLNKGHYLLARYDDSGIELIKKAMELNGSCAEEGMDMIHNYLLKMGLTEKRDELADWQMNLIQKMVNTEPQIYTVKRKDKHGEVDLSEEFLGRLNKFLQSQELVQKIYVLKKLVTDTVCCYQLGVILGKYGKDVDKAIDTITSLNNFVSNEHERFAVFTLVPDDYIKRIFVKKGKLIYQKKS